MHHYARGIAYATLKDPRSRPTANARCFATPWRRLPADHRFLSNLARDTLAVAEAMLDGEVEYHRGNHDQAYAHLREPCGATTISTTPSHGPGCIRRVTPWPPC